MNVETTNTATLRTSDAGLQFKRIERDIVRRTLKQNLSSATLTRNQLLAAPPPLIRKNGCEVPGDIANDFTAQVWLQKETERVKNAQQGLDAISALEHDLTTLGLPIIAVLPTALWRHLTKSVGVYRFEHFDSAGRVPAQPLGTFANLKFQLHAMPTLELISKLWPQCHDDIATGIRVTPYFPQAPEHFQRNLLKLAATQYPVHIAAVPEAITVSRKEVLDTHVKANLVPPAALPAAPEDDPILYTKSSDGQLVALLDYFGRFPNEEELVQRAQDYYASLDRKK